MGPGENQYVELPILTEKKLTLCIKREDLIHPLISGNKYRKLKYNIATAKAQSSNTLLTFGGAYSNHIAATAYAGRLHGLRTIGIIRGEELEEKWMENPTLRQASEHGMYFKFVAREVYRKKESHEFLKLLEKEFGNFYLLPEGGSNALAVKGCEEILGTEDWDFDVVSCAVGTGATVAGIANSAHAEQQVLGFPVLKGDFLSQDIRKFARKENWKLLSDYHFDGYAKVTPALVHFINDFRDKTHIPLDSVYTGKMIFGILDMVKKDYFSPKTKILAIHTGGLQGIAGMNQRLKMKNLPLIHV